MAPTATRRRQRAVHNKPRRPTRTKLYPVDLATWDDGRWARPVFRDTLPEEIGEPWPYRFKNGDGVWIRACNGEWYQGRAVGQAKKGKTRRDKGLWWCIQFRMGRVNIRKWVAPLNGDVKPDAEHTRRLLPNTGRLLPVCKLGTLPRTLPQLLRNKK